MAGLDQKALTFLPTTPENEELVPVAAGCLESLLGSLDKVARHRELGYFVESQAGTSFSANPTI